MMDINWNSPSREFLGIPGEGLGACCSNPAARKAWGSVMDTEVGEEKTSPSVHLEAQIQEKGVDCSNILSSEGSPHQAG